MTLARHELTAELIVHPQLLVRRDVSGLLREVLGPIEVSHSLDRMHQIGADSAPDEIAESWTHIEVATLAEGKGSALAADLERGLGDVRLAVEDYPKMRRAAARLADRLAGSLADQGLPGTAGVPAADAPASANPAESTSDNSWWLDVLENGESSVYAGFFDIDWLPLKDELHGKVLIPVLHDHYGAVLESGELKLVFHPERGEFDVSYRNHRFPVDPREYPRILQHCAGTLAAKLGEQNPDLLEFQSLITAFGHLPGRQEVSSDRIAERNRDKEIHKRRLVELCARSQEIATCILGAVELINGTPADPASFEELHELIKAQTFRLANWRVASDDVNYRRFFDTNDLASICVENETVFQATHRLVLSLVADGKVDGFRVDHPDGLFDPAQYFERLQRSIALAANNSETTGNGSHYVVIEKILSGPERLPAEWPVCGTTGYDFANLVNGVFVDPAAVTQFERIYRDFIDDDVDIDDLFYDCRKLIIRVALASELNVLANQIAKIALSKRHTCDFTLNSLHDALTEVVASFPVYRTYVSPSGVTDNDVRYIRSAIASAKWRSPAADTSIFDFVGQVLLTSIAEGQDPAYRNRSDNLRHEIPAIHQPGDGQGPGRHRLLQVQPPGLLE